MTDDNKAKLQLWLVIAAGTTAVGGAIYLSMMLPQFATVPIDASTPDTAKWPHWEHCVPWSSGTPSTVHWYSMPATIEPGSRAALKLARPSADAGLGADYVLLQFGLVPVDGGIAGEVVELRKQLISFGIIPTEDRSFIRRIASPIDTNCRVGIYREEDVAAPRNECACAGPAGCWQLKNGIWKPGPKDTTFGPGKWKSPDGGGVGCVPKVCTELAGRNSMPKECQ